jgi:flagellar motor switch protein FliG
MNAVARTRQAALLVHGLPESTRARVLARLSAQERAQVEPLLAELASMGIPNLHFEEATLPRAEREIAKPIERVSELETSQVLHALQKCTPATIAQILRIADWPWKALVLSGLGHARRANVMLMCKSIDGSPAPRLAELLLLRLLTEVEGAGHVSMAARPWRALKRLLVWKQ